MNTYTMMNTVNDKTAIAGARRSKEKRIGIVCSFFSDEILILKKIMEQ